MTEKSKEHFEHNVEKLARAVTKINYFDFLREKEMFGAEEEQQLSGVVENLVTAGAELREWELAGVAAAFTVNSASFGICNYVSLVCDPRVTLPLIDERWEAHKKSSIYEFLNEELIEKIAETEEQKEAAQKMCKLMEAVADDYSTCIALIIANGIDRFKDEYTKAVENLRVFEKRIKENGQEYLDVTLQLTAAITLLDDQMFPNAIYSQENIKAAINKLCDEIFSETTPSEETVDSDKEALDSILAFCAAAPCIIREEYVADMNVGDSLPMAFAEAHEQMKANVEEDYSEVMKTYWGVIGVFLARNIMCSWFGRVGNPAVGETEQRIERYKKVWDDWEKAHATSAAQGEISKVLMQGWEPDSWEAYEIFGRRIAEVISTMTHNAQFPDNPFPLVDAFYEDYKYVYENIRDGIPAVRTAVQSSVAYLPSLSQRFPDIGMRYMERWWSNLLEGQYLKGNQPLKEDTRPRQEIFDEAVNDCVFDYVFAKAEDFKDLIEENIEDIASNFVEENEYVATGAEPRWLMVALAANGAVIDSSSAAQTSTEPEAPEESKGPQGNLIGQTLIDFLKVKEAEGMEVADMSQAAGYGDDTELLVSQLMRARGDWPIDIPRGTKDSEPWVFGYGEMARATAYFERFNDIYQDAKGEGSLAESAKNIYQNAIGKYYKHFNNTNEYAKGFAHCYIMFTTYAMFRACGTTGEAYSEEAFASFYRNCAFRIDAHNKHIFSIPEDERKTNLDFAIKFDNYIYYGVNVLMNYLLNMTDDGKREGFDQDGEHFQEWLKLHHYWEDQNAFDEICVFKQSLISTILAYSPIAIDTDGKATTAYLQKANDFLNQFNKKRTLGTDEYLD